MALRQNPICDAAAKMGQHDVSVVTDRFRVRKDPYGQHRGSDQFGAGGHRRAD